MPYSYDIVAVRKGSNRQKYDGTQGPRIMEMAEQGLWPEEWCAELGIRMSTLYAWADRYPEFEEALHNAWVLLHAWAARTWRENLNNPNFRQTMFTAKMQRRLPSTFGAEPRVTQEGYCDRNAEPEPVGEDAAEIEEDENSRELERINAKIAALKARRAHDA